MSRQGLSDLIDRLQRAGLDLDGEDLADILWLAQQIQTVEDYASELNTLDGQDPGQTESE